MNQKSFLSTLHQYSQGFLELRALGGHGKPWQEFAKLDAYNQINSFSVNATLQKKNVYFGVGTRDGQGGKKENLVSIPAVWVDIDFKDVSREATLKALKEFPFKATAIILSGNGGHCYWIFKEPLSPADDPTAISKIEDVNRRIAAYLHGDLASVDATRILRMPDSKNWKYVPPRPVKVTHLADYRYELDVFLDVLPEAAPPPPSASNNGQTKSEYVNENLTMLMKCDFLKWAMEKPADVKEPLWHALISNLASVRAGGVSLCHELSKGHPGYSAQETNEKILHCLEESRPMSCAKIQKRGFTCKKTCGVTSPAGLLFSLDDGVQEDVKFAQIEFVQGERDDAEVVSP